jgi:subtilisin family serine protease
MLRSVSLLVAARRSPSARVGAALGLAVVFSASLAPAQLELGSALQDLQRHGVSGLPRAVLATPSQRVAVLAEYASDSGVSELLVGGRYRPMWLEPEQLAAFASEHPSVKLHWAPPRHTLLDAADAWIGGSDFRQSTGLSGQGVVIGIVDTGLDISHADLRAADGSSRVRYMLDFSRPPSGREPELEAEYGCTDETECAIYSDRDLDELLANGVTGDEPQDTFGHGTHVASLAAGNGLSNKKPRYIGVAPEATLFGARVSRSGDGSIFDADIIQATRFIFEQAERLGMPAVVNLSLGSDFGTHDGSSPLEQALASFVGPAHPGRAIVVAAGNSGGLYSGSDSGEPEPLGIHTEVHVPRESPVEIPLLTPTEKRGGMRGGTFYVWLGFRPGDAVSIALDKAGHAWIPEIAPGEATTFNATGFQGTVFNGPTVKGSSIAVGESNAVVVVDGDFDPGTVFTLRLSGHGSASLWVQASGGVSPDTSVGVLVPRGEKQGTINIPASSPDLISVGATVNRNHWLDSRGKAYLVGEQDSDNLIPLDGVAYFSAVGPNALGVMKPDLVAPGMYVMGAMSSAADPRSNGGAGVFASDGRCGSPDGGKTADYECFVSNDDAHAITSGTSMSAPLVSGAVALLLQRRPELTQPQIRALLQTGARPATGPVVAEQQAGAGVLDLGGTLAALIAEDSPADRLPSATSRIVLAAPFAHPDPSWPLSGLLELRDEQDQVADGFDARGLALSVAGGSLLSPISRLGPGLYSFELGAPVGSGGQSLALRLSFDGQLLAERTVPIGTDRWAAEGSPSARGGCGVVGREPRGAWAWLGAPLALMLLQRLRRRARPAHKRAK